MSINFASFFTLSYWFDLSPPPLDPAAQKIIFIVFGGIVILGAVLRIVRSRKKHDKYVLETLNRVGSLCLSMGFVGLLIFFFSFEQIQFFSARFWYLVWLAATAVWAGYIVRYAVKIVPARRREAIERKEQEKYLPKSKKKKKR